MNNTKKLIGWVVLLILCVIVLAVSISVKLDKSLGDIGVGINVLLAAVGLVSLIMIGFKAYNTYETRQINSYKKSNSTIN